MKKIVFILMVFIVSFSCKRNDCKKDLFFDKKFNNCIHIMTISEKGEDMSIEEKLDAIRFLEAVTAYKSHIDDLEYPVYKDKNIFKKDKNAWESWYKTNRCKLTDSQIDSLINIYNSYEF